MRLWTKHAVAVPLGRSGETKTLRRPVAKSRDLKTKTACFRINSSGTLACDQDETGLIHEIQKVRFQQFSKVIRTRNRSRTTGDNQRRTQQPPRKKTAHHRTEDQAP